VGIVVVQLEGAEREAVQFSERGLIAQGSRARSPAQSAGFHQAAEGMHQVLARGQHARNERTAHFSQPDDDQADARPLHRSPPGKGLQRACHCQCRRDTLKSRSFHVP
jgi:hypothetical protein